MRKINVLKMIRIIVYIVFSIFILILKFTNKINWPCYIYTHFGILCPTCGLTRAVIAILNLDFSLAVQENAYCTLILIPIFIILLVDDIICMIRGKRSFVDIILGE